MLKIKLRYIYYTYNNKEYLMLGVELKDDKLFMKLNNISDNKECFVDLDYFYIHYKRIR